MIVSVQFCDGGSKFGVGFSELFILGVIDDTYVRTLKDPTTYYTKVRPNSFLKHLRSTCGGLHSIDAVSLISDMQRYYETTTSIPEFINKLEDAQKKAQRANVPIADSTLRMYRRLRLG